MWFEVLFKYSRETWAEASLVFTGLPAVWLVPAMVAGLLLIGISALRGARLRGLGAGRRAVLAGLQVVVLLLVVALLAGPALRLTELVPGANRIAVLLDDSASMAQPAATGATVSRRDAATTLLQQQGLLPALQALADVDLYRFGGDVMALASLDVAPLDDDRTHLQAAIARVAQQYRDLPLAAIVVLTDGADNAPAGARDSADGVPVHAIGFGATEIVGDVELVDVELPLTVRPNTRIEARALVRHGATRAAELRVWDGDALLAARTIEPPPGGAARPVPVDLTFDSGSAGVRDLTFELSPLPDEPITDNNARRYLLTVEPQPLRVLYLEGEPRWEYRFIRLAADGDDSLELVSWLRTSPRKTLRQGVADAAELDGGFPQRLEDLFGYDLVVLGSLPAHLLDDEQHAWLEAFVAERGGAVLALAGRDALSGGGWQRRPLAAALPVSFDAAAAETAFAAREFSARPTRHGRASSLLALDAEGGSLDRAWSSLPPLGDLYRVTGIKPAATVLLEAVGEDAGRQWRQPLLIEQHYGRGRSAVLATGSTWRWQMRTPPDDGRHHRFWRQLLRQLAEAAPRRARLDLALDAGGDLTLELALRDPRHRPVAGATVHAAISAADVEPLHVTLTEVPGGGGRYRGTLAGALDDERSRIRVDVDAVWSGGAESTTRFLTRPTTHPEAFGAAQNRSLLQRVAERSGGRYWQPADAAAALPDALRFAGSGVTERRLLELWNMPAALLLLLLGKAAEWLLRRRWGVL